MKIYLIYEYCLSSDIETLREVYEDEKKALDVLEEFTKNSKGKYYYRLKEEDL